MIIRRDTAGQHERRGAECCILQEETDPEEMNMEIFDIVDAQGNPTGERVERNRAHTEGIRHRTAHIWVLREREGRYQVLLQKRSQNKDSFPGRYDNKWIWCPKPGTGYKIEIEDSNPVSWTPVGDIGENENPTKDL